MMCLAHINFWQNVDYDLNQNPGIIKVVVKALRLEGDVRHAVLLSEAGVYDGFKSIRYEGTEFIKRREIKKSYLSKEWRFIAYIFISCLDHRK